MFPLSYKYMFVRNSTKYLHVIYKRNYTIVEVGNLIKADKIHQHFRLYKLITNNSYKREK